MRKKLNLMGRKKKSESEHDIPMTELKKKLDTLGL